MPSAWPALLRQRCPRCRRGRIFSGSITTNKQCPDCGLVFEREPGYFVGAMYISYPIGFAFLGLFMLTLHLIWPEVDLSWMLLLAMVAFAPFVPFVFRLSRTIWIWFDRWAWPTGRDGS